MKSHIPLHSKQKNTINIFKYIKKLSIVLFICALSFVVINSIYKLLTIKTTDVAMSTERLKFDKKDEIEKLLVILVNDSNEISAINVYTVNTERDLKRAVYIPSWVYVMEYSGNYDTKISVKDFSYVGRNINPDLEYVYIIWQSQNIVATNFDSYLVIEEKTLRELDYKLDGSVNTNLQLNQFIHNISLFELFRNINVYSNKDNKLYSNKSAFELFIIFSELNNAKTEVKDVDLGGNWALINEILPNGKTINTFNYSLVDQELTKNIEVFKPIDISKEQVKFEVYNGSGVSKAALRYSRMVQNLGAKVVRTGNAPDNYPKTQIYVSNKENYKNSLELLEKIFIGDIEIIEGRPNFMTTGDIIIILGEDIKREIEWK